MKSRHRANAGQVGFLCNLLELQVAQLRKSRLAVPAHNEGRTGVLNHVRVQLVERDGRERPAVASQFRYTVVEIFEVTHGEMSDRSRC